MYERMLVPLDGSVSAEAILPFAEQVAGPLDAEMVLFRRPGASFSDRAGRVGGRCQPGYFHAP